MLLRPLSQLHQACPYLSNFHLGSKGKHSLQGAQQDDSSSILSSSVEDALCRQPLSVLTFGVGVSVGVTLVLFAILWKIIQLDNEEIVPDSRNGSGNDNEKNRSRSHGSRTAIVALYARSQASQSGFGPDHLAPIILNCLLKETSPLFMTLLVHTCGFLSRLNYRVTHRIFEDQIAFFATLGYTGLVGPLHARTCWLDDCVKDFVTQNKETNVIILGSGFDTRCYRLLQRAGVSAYEVDVPGTLDVKKQVLGMADIGTSTTVLVECDFEKQDWLQRLKQVGLDVSFPTLIVWEGVTMYLSEATILETLQKVSHYPHWSIAFDYIDREWAQSWLWQRAMRRVGEPFQFSMAAHEPLELLESCDLQLVEHWSFARAQDNNNIARRYFPMRTQEQPVGYIGNYGGFVLAQSRTAPSS